MTGRHPDKKDDEKKGGGIPLIAARGAGSEASLAGSGPLARLRGLFLGAGPSTTTGLLLRLSAGVVVALAGSWAAFSALSPRSAAKSAGSPFLSMPASIPQTTQEMPRRPSVAEMVFGLRALVDPDILADAPAAEDSSASPSATPPDAGNGASVSASATKPAAEGSADTEGVRPPQNPSTPAGSGAFSPAGVPQTASSSGGESPTAGGAGQLAAMPSAPRPGAAKTLSTRPSNVRGKGAMKQLRFAANMSEKGKFAAGGEGAYQAAQGAFTGQTTGTGAQPIGGSGASTGGQGISAGVPATPPTTRGSVSSENTCPAGYVLDASQQSCVPSKSSNQTPYQGLVDTARLLLIGAALLALLGLYLVTQTTGWTQVLGGVMLGAALALIVAALAISQQIGQKYGQSSQQKTIENAAEGAHQGSLPE